LSGSRESKNSDKMGEEFGMHGNEVNLEQIIDWKKVDGRVHSEGVREYRTIILQWVLKNCMSLDFEYSCFERVLSDILMNFVINCTCHKIMGNILIRLVTIGVTGNTVY